MKTIPGWDDPIQESNRDHTCYWRIRGQRPGQSSEQHISELLTHGIFPRRMFIKVKGSDFSGGVLFMPGIGELSQEPRTAEKSKGPWEVVLESGKWVRYDLDLAIVNGDLVIEHGNLKFTRLGTSTPVTEKIESIEELATWLEKQVENNPTRDV
jgi:hypothetical protein